MSDPSEVIYALAEQAYVRMQAEDLLIRCLDEGDVQPIQSLVEELVLAGPKSLGVMQEILAETRQRRSQLGDDLRQLMSELKDELEHRAIHLPELERERVLPDRLAAQVLEALREQGGFSPRSKTSRLQNLDEVDEIISTLRVNLGLLGEIVSFLEDWIWALVYQSARKAVAESYLTNLGGRRRM